MYKFPIFNHFLSINFLNKYKEYLYLLFGFLILLLFFHYLFGLDKLNPSNMDWLYRSDTKKHLLGWLFFQQTEMLQWPIGKIYNYGQYPWSNIVFVDTIPLLSILFKYIPVIPSPGQYFGIWFLICFSLQFYFAFRLLENFSKNYAAILSFSFIFVLSPAMLARSGFTNELLAHPALMAHWLIIASMYLYFQSKWRNVLWTIILVIAYLTHLYLAAIVTTIFIFDFISRKRFKFKDIVIFFSIFLILIFITFNIGYFVSNIEFSASGYGRYRFNLLGFFDSNNQWSRFLKDIPTSKNGEHEGFSYLGIGIILLLFFSLFQIKKLKLQRIQKREKFFILLIFFFLLYSISNNIFISRLKLFSYEIYFFESFFNIFRSSGRFIWPVIYSIILLSFLILLKIKKKFFAKICFLILIVQIIDFSHAIQGFLNAKVKSENLFHFDDELISLTKKFDKVIVVGNDTIPELVGKIGFLAILNKQDINPAFIFRRSKIYMKESRDKNLQNLLEGKIDKDIVYFFDQKDMWLEYKSINHKNLLFLDLGGFYLAFHKD
jgi:hypothetical protein